MDLNSIRFLVFAVGVITIANCFPSAAGKRAVLAFASAAFIASYAGGIMQLVPLLLYLVICFGVVTALQSHPSRAALWAGVSAIVLCFVYLKRFGFIEILPELPFAYLVIGLSYILFRVIHLAVDASQGELRGRLSPLDFFNYTCNFLSFVSGPIQRYQDFSAAQEKRLDLDREQVFSAFSRVISGFIKVVVVSAIANHVFGRLSERLFEGAGVPGITATAGLLAATAAAYAVYLYYNFAGYMDIVIGIGRLIGCELPENFDRPFSSRNFLEFWSRWHMTLSNWFKVYVFNPLLKSLTMRFQTGIAPPVLGVIAFFVTFLVMGMWHGTTSVFLVYGLVLGAGASANKMWQIGMTRYLGKKRYREISGSLVYAAVSTGMTTAWFALALICFWVDMRQLVLLMDWLGWPGFLLAFFVLTASAGVVLPTTQHGLRRLAPAVSWFATQTRGLAARNLLLGARVVMITGVASMFHKAPEFVYRAF